jgi:hypothetical protein
MVPITNLSGRLGNQMFQLAFIYNLAMEGKIPDIYLQDPKYFRSFDREIKTLFSEGIRRIDMVSIHVRRGKNPLLPSEPRYCDNPFYVNLWEIGYYEKAMALFPDDKFLVFSDDIEWCKQNFKGDRFEFSHGTEIEDMNNMAGCKHNIIANSSFSWWAAFLNPNPMKTVVAPSKEHWYSDGVERTVCPISWKRI